MTKLRTVILAFVLAQLLLPVPGVLADTGPKPTMDFEFKQESTGEQLTITSGVLYECEQPDCSDASPLMEGGPQRFTCEANSCHALAYGFRPYHRLELQFSDGITRRSNVFETAGFTSKYTVTVRPEDLLVDAAISLDRFSRIAIILLACLCALVVVGLLVMWIILRRSKKN